MAFDFNSATDNNEIIVLVESVAGVKLSQEERALFVSMLQNIGSTDPTVIAAAIKNAASRVVKKPLSDAAISAIDNGLKKRSEQSQARSNKWAALKDESDDKAQSLNTKSGSKPIQWQEKLPAAEFTKETATLIIAKAEEKLSLPLDKMKREQVVNGFLKGLKPEQSPINIANMALLGVANAAFAGCISVVVLHSWGNPYGIADINREHGLTAIDQVNRNAAMRDAVLDILRNREVEPQFMEGIRKQLGAPELDSGASGSGKSSAPKLTAFQSPLEAMRNPFGTPTDAE